MNGLVTFGPVSELPGEESRDHLQLPSFYQCSFSFPHPRLARVAPDRDCTKSGTMRSTTYVILFTLCSSGW
jgi:hypothetical protein